MDWQGQKRAESVMQILLAVFALAAFVAGYAIGSFRTMMLTYAAGVIITALVTIPNWPFFNRHPLKWLDPAEAERHPRPPPQPSPNAPSSSTTKKKGSSSKKHY